MRFLTRCAAMMMAAAVVGCDEPAAPAKDVGGKGASAKPRIALVMKTLTNPFFVEMEKGARRAESEFGVELLVKTAAQETSIEQQVAIVADLIRQKVDAVVIAPGDSVKLIPILKNARDEGVKVVNIDNRLDPDYSNKLGLTGVSFISVDNEKGAYQAVKALVGNMTAPAKAAVIEGIRGAANAQARKAGALRGFAEAAGVEVVASQSANWKIDESYETAKTIMAAHPDVSLIFCANDMMALGAVKYLKEAGALGKVKVAGFDALTEAVDAVKVGDLAVTVDQQAAEQGFLGVKAAVTAIRGGAPPLETMIDVRVITRPSAAQ